MASKKSEYKKQVTQFCTFIFRLLEDSFAEKVQLFDCS
jgi:hypothetical protein